MSWGLLAYLGWTLVSLPYTAWGAELSDDYDRRASITASREGFMIAGTLLAIAWPAIIGTGRADAVILSGLAWILVITLPLAVGIAFPLLPLLGFDPQAREVGSTLVLALFYGAAPIPFKLAAMAIVWRFPHDRSAHAAVRSRLAAEAQS